MKWEVLRTNPVIWKEGLMRREEASVGSRTGTLIFWNIVTPLRTSASATSCGVETMTAPI